MTIPPVIWLASYPRSGNTFLRTIIYHCFGVRSASIYSEDMGALGPAHLIGHIEQRPDGSMDFGDAPVRLIKTHHPPQDDRPAIYIVRDGQAATMSMFEFYGKRMSLEVIIEGHNLFGSWGGHLRRWRPVDRPGTLLLRYEDVLADIPRAVDKLAEYLNLKPNSYIVPPREELARADGKWIRSEKKNRSQLSGAELEQFWKKNGEQMRGYGYARLTGPDTPAGSPP